MGKPILSKPVQKVYDFMSDYISEEDMEEIIPSLIRIEGLLRQIKANIVGETKESMNIEHVTQLSQD